MPIQPHPITFTINDVDSNAKENARCYVRNITKKSTSAEKLTNSSGNAIIDLANLPLGNGQSVEYEAGDEVLLIAYFGNTHDAIPYTVAGQSKDQTLTLNAMGHIPLADPNTGNLTSVQRLMQILGANTSSSVAYFKVFAVADGELLAHVEVPANNSINVQFGATGKQAGSFVLVREAITLVVTATIK